ncbi:MAG: preprotein translocase subunit YajC [Phycisphaerae bacterium]
MLFPLAAMGLIFWLIFFRPRAKEQKQFKAMLANLKKGDRVMTIGGILGTVVNLKDDEITLKVDESTNTKMTFTRSSIKNVISPTAGSGTTR